MGDFSETTTARGKALGDRIFGFWSQEVVEHICGVGFIRQSLELCRSDKLSHGLLGCWILTQHRAIDVARCESRSSRQTCVTSDGGMHVRIFFAM